jgi:hypothetical protein
MVSASVFEELITLMPSMLEFISLLLQDCRVWIHDDCVVVSDSSKATILG